MARTVTLSDEAFAALRAEKGEGESDSDVLLRLRAEARAKRKDPWLWFRAKHDFAFTEEEYERIRRKVAEADRRNPWTD